MCGQNQIKGNLSLDEKKRNLIENYQVDGPSQLGFCSHVVISDKLALTTANCWETADYQTHNEKLRFIIRQDTEFEEVMNVKRFWTNPWRRSRSTSSSAYYDIVIMEFGNFFVNISISVHTHFFAKVRYSLPSF